MGAGAEPLVSRPRAETKTLAESPQVRADLPGRCLCLHLADLHDSPTSGTARPNVDLGLPLKTLPRSLPGRTTGERSPRTHAAPSASRTYAHRRNRRGYSDHRSAAPQDETAKVAADLPHGRSQAPPPVQRRGQQQKQHRLWWPGCPRRRVHETRPESAERTDVSGRIPDGLSGDGVRDVVAVPDHHVLSVNAGLAAGGTSWGAVIHLLDVDGCLSQQGDQAQSNHSLGSGP